MSVATSLTADILELISTLYGIEAEVRGKPPDVRLAARQSRKESDGRCVMRPVDAARRQLSPKPGMEGYRLWYEALAPAVSLPR